jgi:hypothetical protein
MHLSETPEYTPMQMVLGTLRLLRLFEFSAWKSADDFI